MKVEAFGAREWNSRTSSESLAAQDTPWGLWSDGERRGTLRETRPALQELEHCHPMFVSVLPGTCLTKGFHIKRKSQSSRRRVLFFLQEVRCHTCNHMDCEVEFLVFPAVAHGRMCRTLFGEVMVHVHRRGS